MRIAIDILVAEKWYGDLHASVRTLLRELARLEPGNEYILITGRPEEYREEAKLSNVCIYPVKLPPRQGILIQYQLHLPNVLRRLRPDALHVQSCVAPIGWSGPLVVSAQDTFFDDNGSRPTTRKKSAALDRRHDEQARRDYRQRLVRASICRANRIIAPSERICKELTSRYWIEKERVCVITDALSVESVAQVMLLAYQQALVNHAGTIDTEIDAGGDTEVDTGVGASATQKNAVGVTEREGPAISVIMPVSRPVKAARALAALEAQRYAGEVETIVVGAAATALSHDWPVLSVNSGHIRQPGKARNLGAAQARGEILLFLDDDAVVAQDWIERNVRALQRPGVGIVGARIVGKSDAFFARCIDFTNYGQYQHGQPFDGPVASTSMGVMRTVFQKVGGFDETLLSGEDIDFCYRVQKQGYRSVYQPDIVVTHDHRRDTFRTLLRYNYTHGIEGGLATKIRHRDAGLKNRLLCFVRAPALFLLLLPLIALLASVRIVAINIPENRRVLLYALFIFLGKLAYEFGIFMHLLKRAQSIDRR